MTVDDLQVVSLTQSELKVTRSIATELKKACKPSSSSSSSQTLNDKAIAKKQLKLNDLERSIEHITSRQSRNKIDPEEAAEKQSLLLEKFR